MAHPMKQNSFAIMRTGKIKDLQKLAIASMHNTRTAHPDNADPSKENKLLAGSHDALGRYNELIDRSGVTVRSNSVKAIELLFTFSPEMTNKIDVLSWSKDTMKFVESVHHRSTILQAELHLDETTPHIHVLVVPLVQKKVKIRGKDEYRDEVRLSCRDFLGGADKLRALQDRYAEAVKHHGLERGIRGSKAHHKNVRRFYAELNSDIKAAVGKCKSILQEIPKASIFNIKKQIVTVTKIIKNEYLQSLVAAGKLKGEEARNKSMQVELTKYRGLVDEFRSALGQRANDREVLSVLKNERRRRLHEAIEWRRQEVKEAQERYEGLRRHHSDQVEPIERKITIKTEEQDYGL